MWKRSLLVFLFSLLAPKAVLGCETRTGTNKFMSPHLNSKTRVVMKGQNVSLICFNQNKSPQISYSLFRQEKHLRTQEGKGEPVVFNLSILEVRDLGPYKCKAQVANCSRYSRDFNFAFVDPVTTPILNIQTETDQYITLHCISFNGSLPINYTFFKNDIAMSPVISKCVREPAEFNLTKKNTGIKEEYRCKAENELPDYTKYSQSFTMPSTGGDSCPFCLQLLLPALLLVLIVIILILAFRILPKYKTRKAMKDEVPRGYGKMPMEDGLYANVVDESVPGSEPRLRVSTAQGETRLSQEIHYATPTFQEVTPDHEAHKDGKTGCVYSELSF